MLGFGIYNYPYVLVWWCDLIFRSRSRWQATESQALSIAVIRNMCMLVWEWETRLLLWSCFCFQCAAKSRSFVSWKTYAFARGEREQQQILELSFSKVAVIRAIIILRWRYSSFLRYFLFLFVWIVTQISIFWMQFTFCFFFPPAVVITSYIFLFIVLLISFTWVETTTYLDPICQLNKSIQFGLNRMKIFKSCPTEHSFIVTKSNYMSDEQIIMSVQMSDPIPTELDIHVIPTCGCTDPHRIVIIHETSLVLNIQILSNSLKLEVIQEILVLKTQRTHDTRKSVIRTFVDMSVIRLRFIISSEIDARIFTFV